MVAYDASYGTPAAARQSLGDKISDLFGRKAPNTSVPANTTAPAPDYVLTPDAHGRITLAGRQVPIALALLGLGVGAFLLINRRTRGPVLAAATTAWGVFGKKTA
jgi:hypothetical protein